MDLNEVAIVDIECFSKYDIDKEGALYRADAKIKYIGFYSYEFNKYYEIRVKGNEAEIIRFLQRYKVIVTFNGDNFDIPIMKNSKNRFLDKDAWIKSIDLYTFFFGDDKWKKGKADLMELDFPKKSLRVVGETLGLTTIKGDIDYSIFEKDDFTDEEDAEIKKYLHADLVLTKEAFDKVYNFWLPFAQFIGTKNANKWRWLTSTIATIGYMYFCNTISNHCKPEDCLICKNRRCEEVYDEKDNVKGIGGKVIEPRINETDNVYYLDIGSLYPHIYALFKLFNECSSDNPNAWHGNSVFKVNGYYDIVKADPVGTDMMLKFKLRKELKRIDKHNPLVYAIKILLNSMYGASRSTVFKNMHTPNCGEDCCWLGQQMNDIMEKMFTELGYWVIAGDTDSNFIKPLRGQTIEQVRLDIKKVIDFILANVPCPQPTFDINIENDKPLDYIKFVPSEGKILKKNYIYVCNNKLTVMGLPIIKGDATKLGKHILDKYLRQQIIDNKSATFSEKYITELIQKELKEDITLIARNFNVNRYEMYSKKTNCIQKQISEKYLDKKAGSIVLIKNDSIGKVGTDWKYCTLEESKTLSIQNLDLKKVYNELKPFMKIKVKAKAKGLMDYD